MAGFLGPISSKITLTKKEERRKRKSEEEERRRSKRKSNCCTFSFYNSYFRVFGREKLFDIKGPFADTVFKTPARTLGKISSIDPK